VVLNITLDEKHVRGGGAYLHLPRMTSEEFLEFCERNPTLNVERNANGDVILMAPADSYGETRNAEIVTDLTIWNRQLPEPGLVFSSSAGFTLPDGAELSPDASWVPMSRWNALAVEQRKGLARICPDFILELMLPTDTVPVAKTKMEKWMGYGARLGILINRKRRTVYLYRAGVAEPESLVNPASVSCDPVLPGFTLDMARVFA
jgi:Uma2 family endonuclease